MARTPASVAASRIQIEDEVWEEAFSSRVPSRRRQAPTSVNPARPTAGPRSAGGPAFRIAEAPVLAAFPDDQDVRPGPVGAPGPRRTVRIQGRGADPYRSRTTGEEWTPSQAFPVVRSVGSSPDRLAMWAALLGFLLVAVALLSSHL